MNVELLEKVKAEILARPESLNMHAFDCGTQACIAGWACRLELGDYDPLYADVYAPKLLDLDGDQSDRLFFLHDEGDEVGRYWPPVMSRAYEHTTDPEERARITAARIDLFIVTNGAE